jgi:hypothetical protein
VGVTLARGLIGGFGALLLMAGVGIAALGAGVFAALMLFVPGALMLAAVLLERTRYRSLHAERTGDAHGPGGGETTALPARFRATDERFVDPTTQVPMQVFVDPATGERRYVPLT